MFKIAHKIFFAIGHFVARILTWILMPLVYWIPFALTAIGVKLVGKPLLPRVPRDKNSNTTYWLDRPEVSKDLEKMKRQF